jgi:hypothetical protein
VFGGIAVRTGFGVCATALVAAQASAARASGRERIVIGRASGIFSGVADGPMKRQAARSRQ